MYTLGPWKKMPNSRGLICNGRESEVVGTFHSRNKDNWTVVLAAPDLLLALKDLMGADLGLGNLSVEQRRLFNRAQAAIDKAEGR